LKIFFLVLHDKNFLCSGEYFSAGKIRLFWKMDKNKCPFLTFPKKSWKKKRKFASTCVGPLFWHFLWKVLIFPTLCSIFNHNIFIYDNIFWNIFNNFIFFFKVVVSWSSHWLYNHFVILIWEFGSCFYTIWMNFFKFWY